MSRKVDTWGLYAWGNAKEKQVHPEDLDKLAAFPHGEPIGQVLRCVDEDESYVTLKYGDVCLRVTPESYLPMTDKMNFEIGDEVYVKAEPEKKGIVYDVQWHYNDNAPMFFIKVNGTRKSTRRYAESELAKV